MDGEGDMVEKIIRPRMEHDHPAWEAYVREQAKSSMAMISLKK